MAGSDGGGVEVVTVDCVEEVEAFLRWLGERRPILAFDTETTGLDRWRDHVRLCQFGDAHTAWVLPYRDWRGLVRHVFDRYEGPLVAHNAKFDVAMLEMDGLTVPRHRVHDTMIMTHLVDSHGPKGLKQAAKRYVAGGAGGSQADLKEAMRRSKWTWETIPEDFKLYTTYAGLDTVLTARLAETLWPRVQPFRDAYELEVATAWVLVDLERRGLRVDTDYCERTRDRLTAELEEIEARWPDLNLHSHDQVLALLQREGVPLLKRTEGGNLALDEAVLAALAHPVARDVLVARDLKKTVGTYLDNYLELAVDGVLHCDVSSLGAEKTGRMSISKPSFQNVPRKKLVRDAITASAGCRLVLADAQAQETRLVAHFSRDPAMVEAFVKGDVDIHRFVASMVYRVPYGAVNAEQRRRSKQAGHARNYGAGATKIALTADISPAEAAAFVKEYDAQFPGIAAMNKQIMRTLRQREANGWSYVTTYSGRRVQVPMKKAYIGTNYLIQGSGSDALKRGMVRAAASGVGEFLVLPVHDETLWDVPEAELEEALPLIHEAMELTDLRVPLPIETRVVERWGEAYD